MRLVVSLRLRRILVLLIYSFLLKSVTLIFLYSL
ncbi:hypothetical protein CY0110_19342 [Crocosphaera chwakensis CCY0110]|uniref:Uncharacterized protein n=1 Tax=Crocosphaera chwakensis CCY0110 TaxID=391612 RepID=A3IJK0_9CHRO|nr:hypothetical protein CY0110_19342 [Crocosphaera chwakensis CCY0110]